MKLRPLRAPQRPFALLAQLDLVGKGATQVEPDARLALPAVPPALQVMVEEALLKLHAVIEVEPFLVAAGMAVEPRSEAHTSELQSLMRISYAVSCMKKKN